MQYATIRFIADIMSETEEENIRKCSPSAESEASVRKYAQFSSQSWKRRAQMDSMRLSKQNKDTKKARTDISSNTSNANTSNISHTQPLAEVEAQSQWETAPSSSGAGGVPLIFHVKDFRSFTFKDYLIAKQTGLLAKISNKLHAYSHERSQYKQESLFFPYAVLPLSMISHNKLTRFIEAFKYIMNKLDIILEKSSSPKKDIHSITALISEDHDVISSCCVKLS